jgi:hypothetical protein
MYGETFWETLLIPIRMFFQGEDNSYRYFQGVLNPILIVFSPFILLNKKCGRDKYLFAFFSIFFIFMAYFLTVKQVRYILPTIPFLAILAVMGIKGIVDKIGLEIFYSPLPFNKNAKSIARILIFVIVAILLTFNFIYLKNRMVIIKPLPYIFGQETKKAFLKRHLLHYDAVKYVNTSLPEDAVIFTMFLGRRGYYLERIYKNEASFGMNTINQMLNSSVTEDSFREFIRSMHVTHILMRTDLVDNYLKNNFSQEKINRLMNLARKYWHRVYENNGYTVWDLQANRLYHQRLSEEKRK